MHRASRLAPTPSPEHRDAGAVRPGASPVSMQAPPALVHTLARAAAQGGQGRVERDRPAAPLLRRRLPTREREQQIVQGAIRFFADRGLGGQLRDLAREIGVTHALLYHYFPTKQALIDRVYVELFEGLWQPEWERTLDDPTLDAPTKFTRFYCGYARAIFAREWVRILVFSGLADRTISDRFFELLRARLFPRLIRETRRHCGVLSRARPSARELEYLMGLHGGIFYIGLRRSVYEQAVHAATAPLQDDAHDDAIIGDRVQGYLLAARAVLYAAAPRALTPKRAAEKRTATHSAKQPLTPRRA